MVEVLVRCLELICLLFQPISYRHCYVPGTVLNARNTSSSSPRPWRARLPAQRGRQPTSTSGIISQPGMHVQKIKQCDVESEEVTFRTQITWWRSGRGTFLVQGRPSRDSSPGIAYCSCNVTSQKASPGLSCGSWSAYFLGLDYRCPS